MEYDTIRFSVNKRFNHYIENACDECELLYMSDPIGEGGGYLYAIEPSDQKEWFMALGIEQQAELFNMKGAQKNG